MNRILAVAIAALFLSTALPTIAAAYDTSNCPTAQEVAAIFTSRSAQIYPNPNPFDQAGAAARCLLGKSVSVGDPYFTASDLVAPDTYDAPLLAGSPVVPGVGDQQHGVTNGVTDYYVGLSPADHNKIFALYRADNNEQLDTRNLDITFFDANGHTIYTYNYNQYYSDDDKVGYVPAPAAYAEIYATLFNTPTYGDNLGGYNGTFNYVEWSG